MRRGRLSTGALLLVLVTLLFAVPAAYADDGTDTQGYPCATQPAGPGQSSDQCTPQSCPPGETMNAAGQCTTPTPECAPGQTTSPSGQCVTPTTPSCAPGQVMNSSGQCVTPPKTPPASPPRPQTQPVVAAVTPVRSGVAGVKAAVVSRHATAPAAAVAPARATGTLPFTGLQLTVYALVGLALVVGGILLRSTGRRENDA